MEASSEKKSERILIFDESGSELKDTGTILANTFPDAVVTAVRDLEHYRSEIAHNDFDLVVVNRDLSDSGALSLIQELRFKEFEPAVLMLASMPDAKMLSDAYIHGVHKCIIRTGPWHEEVAPAARSLIRLRRLEEENRTLLSKLTEANILLEERNKRLDDFSATLAHDIRGPLGGISMKLEYILDTCEKELDEKFVELLKRAFKSTERLTSIVQGMYEFARLGATAAKMSEVPLQSLVEDVVSDLHFEESLDIKIGIGELPTVWGNANLLRRVFINLINNAVKYNDKKEIVINIGVQGYTERSIAKFAEVFVGDNGPGIPQNEIKDIFTMFSRASTSKGEGEGVGIGLAVVQRIAELHFGKVVVDSSEGVGTKFILHLPTSKIDFIT